MTHIRPSWDEYFMSIAELVGTRATCDRGRSGCIIVRNKQILVTGYVGSPVGFAHCDEVGHELHTVTNDDGTVSEHCVRTVHAEQNAIAQSAKTGVSIDGGTLYCHMTPCYTCAKLLVNSGIRRILVLKDYHQSRKSKDVFDKAGVEFILMTKEVESYARQSAAKS